MKDDQDTGDGDLALSPREWENGDRSGGLLLGPQEDTVVAGVLVVTQSVSPDLDGFFDPNEDVEVESLEGGECRIVVDHFKEKVEVDTKHSTPGRIVFRWA